MKAEYSLNSTSILIDNCVVTSGIFGPGTLSITPLSRYAKMGVDCSGLPRKTYGSRVKDNRMLSTLCESGNYADIFRYDSDL